MDFGTSTTAASSISFAMWNASKQELFATVGSFAMAEPDQEVEIAFQWNTGFNTDGIHSFANGINTIEGGMHVEGFKKALTNAIDNHAGQGCVERKEREPTGSKKRTARRASGIRSISRRRQAWPSSSTSRSPHPERSPRPPTSR